MEHVVVYVTCATPQEAKKIADAVLDKRLVACANIMNAVESMFWWEAKKDHAKETMIVFKTRKDKFEELAQVVAEQHSYECPEIIALPIVCGSASYLKWIDDTLAGTYVKPEAEDADGGN